MGSTSNSMAILFALTATAYTVLFVLLVLSKKANRTRTALLIACAGTIAAAVCLTIGRMHIFGLSGALVELAMSGGWWLFILPLIGRQLVRTTAIIRTTLRFGSLFSTV